MMYILEGMINDNNQLFTLLDRYYYNNMKVKLLKSCESKPKIITTVVSTLQVYHVYQLNGFDQ